ncbi:GNAT family N-acetyltransferase [Agromyces archimandritae]|uniref:GNAT family N-acetyltransferase n=1 Tax=Agromyces archimandritae TaxID=2781962 RepID=UPI001FD5243F|nr:GNAT family N-acetyltransferase [Agromyces archimandritae]
MSDAEPAPHRAEELADAADFVAAGELYRRVFGYDPASFALNANLLSALVRNGGSAVGVRDAGGRLIGFAYGFPASDGHGAYHYSQAAVIDPAHQGRGIGRLLKERQRLVALASGATRMRWAFDPALARNAHFNFDVLGAHGAAFVEDYYHRPGSDRIVAEWPIAVPDPYAAVRAVEPPAGLAAAEVAVPVEIEGRRWMPVPADPAVAAVPRLAERVRGGMRALYEDGFVLVSCVRLGTATSAYLAVPAASAPAAAASEPGPDASTPGTTASTPGTTRAGHGPASTPGAQRPSTPGGTT